MYTTYAKEQLLHMVSIFRLWWNFVVSTKNYMISLNIMEVCVVKCHKFNGMALTFTSRVEVVRVLKPSLVLVCKLLVTCC